MADKLGFSVLGTFQFLRTLRALGPLRLLSRFQGLRVRHTSTNQKYWQCIRTAVFNITVQSGTGVTLNSTYTHSTCLCAAGSSGSGPGHPNHVFRAAGHHSDLVALQPFGHYSVCWEVLLLLQRDIGRVFPKWSHSKQERMLQSDPFKLPWSQVEGLEAQLWPCDEWIRVTAASG